jgi:uncharacterized lipoprotein NlpE involved in copper resistance
MKKKIISSILFLFILIACANHNNQKNDIFISVVDASLNRLLAKVGNVS